MAFKDRLEGVPVIGTALKVQDRYKADAGDQFAGAIGFFGFLSLFPLLILAMAVTGFVLADASDARIAEVAQSIQDAIPGFSAALGGEQGTGVADALQGIIDNRGSVGLIGFVTLLLSGLRVANSAQTATLKIFRVDLLALKGFKRKVQQLLALTALGILAIAGVAASSVLGVVTSIEIFGVMRVLAPILSIAGTFALDVALFMAAYKLFATVDGPPARHLVPGAILGGFGWTVLKLFGATYVSNQVASASELYGALGGVIGLMLLLYLAGRLYVYGAELSAVKHPPPESWETADDADADEATVAEPAVAMATAAGVSESPRARGEAVAPGPHPGGTAPDVPSSLFDAHPEAPDRPPGRPTPDDRSPAISPTTRAEVAARDAATSDDPRDTGETARHALGFAIGVGALAGIVGALRPWETDE